MNDRQTVITISPEMHRAVKMHAALHGRTLKDCVNEAILEWLEKNGQQTNTADNMSVHSRGMQSE